MAIGDEVRKGPSSGNTGLAALKVAQTQRAAGLRYVKLDTHLHLDKEQRSPRKYYGTIGDVNECRRKMQLACT
jgi:hypothetical protein